jgi:hypothetical protein
MAETRLAGPLHERHDGQRPAAPGADEKIEKIEFHRTNFFGTISTVTTIERLFFYT